MNENFKQEVVRAVAEYFLRVVKNNNYYHVFKSTFQRSHKMPKNVSARGYDFFLDTISNLVDTADQHMHRDTMVNVDYDYITVIINLLLRAYLEKGGIDPRKLGMVGQELFNLTCYALYGDKYLDDMEKLNQQSGIRPPRNEREACIISEYEMRTRQGERLDFNRFMAERLSIPEEEFWRSRPFENPAPHDDEFYYDGDDAYAYLEDEDNNNN